jgi:hypothetical protein
VHSIRLFLSPVPAFVSSRASGDGRVNYVWGKVQGQPSLKRCGPLMSGPSYKSSLGDESIETSRLSHREQRKPVVSSDRNIGRQISAIARRTLDLR